MHHRLIVSDPAVMMGKPVVAGTRITVDLILEKVASGETIEQLLEAHPRLTRDAVFAALDYAKEVLRSARAQSPQPTPHIVAFHAVASSQQPGSSAASKPVFNAR